MNLLYSSRTSILTLAHLSSIDLSFSSLTDHARRPTVGNVNRANTGDLLLPATAISFPKYKSKLFFNNGGYDDNNDNLLPFDDDKNLECTSFLRRVSSAFRGGGGISGALSALSVAELKRLLIDRGVDYRDCLEKKDLVDRLISIVEAWPLLPPTVSLFLPVVMTRTEMVCQVKKIVL